MHLFLIDALETCFFCLAGIFCVAHSSCIFSLYVSRSCLYWIVDIRVVDPHRFNADPDPAFFLISDPDPVPNPGLYDKNLEKIYSCKTFLYF
jgi:hypothetical protein